MTDQQIHDYRQRLAKEGIAFDKVVSLAPVNRIYSASSSDTSIEELPSEKAKHLENTLKNFQELYGKDDPFEYISKYAFTEQLLQIKPAPELLLRFLTDRNFYFEEYRKLGNLPRDNQPGGNQPGDKRPEDKRYLSVPTICDFVRDNNSFTKYLCSPKDILLGEQKSIEFDISQFKRNCRIDETTIHCLETSENSIPSDIEDEVRLNLEDPWLPEKYRRKIEGAKADLEWWECAKAVYQRLINPPPQLLPNPDDVEKVFLEKCNANHISTPDQETINSLFSSYRRNYENYHLVMRVFNHGWIPSSIHDAFYKESDGNYAELRDIMQRREDDMRSTDRIISNLNQLSKDVSPILGEHHLIEGAFPFDKMLSHVVSIFEIYIRSLLHLVRKKEYLPILEYQDYSTKQEKPYFVSISRLLLACWKDGKWHELTPLFLYQAFSDNTKAVLHNGKPKLVRKISIAKTTASVRRMSSMTGYRAGINLVLYQKLKMLFHSSLSDRKVCLLQRNPKLCNPERYANPAISERIDREKCIFDSKSLCPFARSAFDWNDFGFYLITGYGSLYHHNEGLDDTLLISQAQIYVEKSNDVEEYEEFNAPSITPDSPENQYPIYRYLFDIRHPVGILEGKLEYHIQSCIPNRPLYLLTTLPTSYNFDMIHPPFEELSNILLQDMHLPAMQRICRIIKRILSEHPEYLDQFRLYMRYPCLQDHTAKFLSETIKQHRLEEQITRYHDYSHSMWSYRIQDSLSAIFEYEIREQIIEKLQEPLRQLTYESIGDGLFAYRPKSDAGCKPGVTIC